MGATFKNSKQADLAAAAEDIYECPALTTAIVLLCQASNIDGVNVPTCDLWWTDDSDADAVTYLLKGSSVPVGAGVGALDGKLVLEAGDKIRGLASAAGDVAVTVSVLELT